MKYVYYSKTEFYQMLICCRANNATDCSAAGVEDVIKLLLQQLSRLLHTTIDNLKTGYIEDSDSFFFIY